MKILVAAAVLLAALAAPCAQAQHTHDATAGSVSQLKVADLLAGVEAMKGAADGKAGRAGLLRVAAALNAYGRHFDHPGWKPLA